jgi:hypothetical protein
VGNVLSSQVHGHVLSRCRRVMLDLDQEGDGYRSTFDVGLDLT